MESDIQYYPVVSVRTIMLTFVPDVKTITFKNESNANPDTHQPFSYWSNTYNL